MKQFFTLTLAPLTLFVLTSTGFAKPATTPVAFVSTLKGNEGRHIGMKSGGGLWLGSKVISGKEIFNLIDLNGAALQDGDAVQIATLGDRPSYWQENPTGVRRAGGKPGPASRFTVKWKQKNRTLSIRTASGKFVSGSGKGKDLVAVRNASDPTAVFELVKNPTRAAASASKASSPKKPATKKPASR